ncbi:Plastocyanin/azurin family domain protein [Sphingomonas antarctica]|uniref:methylamine utilization protein n=1 Tax=Sphingomonas antarctica TaxID=2040274 RepID=UPI0039ED0C8A
MRLLTPILAALIVFATPAVAGNAVIEVRGPDGGPLVDAVVTIQTARRPSVPIQFAWPATMSQHNIAFDPHVLIVPVGSTVTFPNMDKVRHHVYSFSRAKKFDLKLYGRDDTRSVVFDKPGIVAVGCNIHDSMSGFVVVVDTPYAMKTDGNGRVVIANVPAGGATVRVWHPGIRARDNMLSQTATIAPSGYNTTLTIRR